MDNSEELQSACFCLSTQDVVPAFLQTISLPVFHHVSRQHLFIIFLSGWFQELKGKMLSYSVSLCQNSIFISLFPLNRLFRESRGNKLIPGWQLCLAWSREWKQRWMAHLAMPNTISGVKSLLLSPAVQVIFYIFIKMIYFSFLL